MKRAEMKTLTGRMEWVAWRCLLQPVDIYLCGADTSPVPGKGGRELLSVFQGAENAERQMVQSQGPPRGADLQPC
jgi:hypothetical protein